MENNNEEWELKTDRDEEIEYGIIVKNKSQNLRVVKKDNER